jgi:hypothetical protein
VKNRLAFAAMSLLSSGCGYQLAGASTDPLGPLAIVAAPTIVASAAVQEAFVAGARQELAAQGRLASCDPSADVSCPVIVVELARLEESGRAPEPTSSGAPLDRAVSFTLRGRAFVRRKPSAPPERIGRDESSRESFARPDDPRTAHALREEALERAARRLGARVVRGIVW